MVETIISYTHSSHSKLARMATDVIGQLCIIDTHLASSIATRIQQHFAPIVPTENGDVVKTEKAEKRFEVWQWQRSCELLNATLVESSFTEEQSHHMVEALLTKLNSISKEAVDEPDALPAQSIVQLLFRLMELKLLSNSDYLSIITTSTDLISQTRSMPLNLMGSVMKLCSFTTNKTNDEVLKIVREKLVRSELKQFVTAFVADVEKDADRADFTIFYDFYHFIRMLESVLDKTDLKPIFTPTDAPFNSKQSTCDISLRYMIESKGRSFVPRFQPITDGKMVSNHWLKLSSGQMSASCSQRDIYNRDGEDRVAG